LWPEIVEHPAACVIRSRSRSFDNRVRAEYRQAVPAIPHKGEIDVPILILRGEVDGIAAFDDL
jgi:hypothetical protein